jgi:hypothetical protein
MAIQLSTTSRNAMLDTGITSQVGANGRIKIYSGTIPADVASAITGTELVNIPCAATFAGASSSGSISLNGTPLSATASATGTASHFRVTTSGGTAVLQGTVGAGTGDLSFSTVSFVSGATISITSASITAGNA